MLGEGEQRSFMVVYVDDMLIFSPSSKLVKEVMLKLQDKFKCKVLGDVSFYLGVHIERDVEKRCMRVHRRMYLEALAANFWHTAGMRVAKYLGQTSTVGLQYSAAAQRRQKGADGVEPGRFFLTAFSYASYASEPEDMTSVGGFICCVGGGPTSWESKKQVDQALSSVESEYMALFRVVREIVWQRRLLAELGEEKQGPTPLDCDSQGAIALAKNPVLHGLTKHMRVKWHWTRSMVAAGEVELHYVKMTRQPADMMTKRLVEQQHWKCFFTIDLLKQHLFAAETSVVAVGAARGTPRTPFFEGCSSSSLAPSYASAAAVDVLGAEDVGVASASAKRHSSKGKGGRGGEGGSRGGGGGSSGGGGGRGGGGNDGSGGSGSGGSGGNPTGALRGGSRGGQRRDLVAFTASSGNVIFDLDYDAIRSAVYAVSVSAGGDCYLCVPPDPGIEAAALGSSLYTLATKPPHVAASAQLSASGQVASPCLCRLLSHQTLLWHHRLGHPSLPRLLVSGLPRSLPPLPPSPAPPCLPCVEGRQSAAPHTSFPLTTAPLQTLHMDVWGPARVSGQGYKRYFLMVLTTTRVRLQICKRFHQDLRVLRLHSDRGGEFSADLLRDFCHGEGILQSFTLPEFP
ncbi:unnamed protein product [Closterium sp. NIES-54]